MAPPSTPPVIPAEPVVSGFDVRLISLVQEASNRLASTARAAAANSNARGMKAPSNLLNSVAPHLSGEAARFYRDARIWAKWAIVSRRRQHQLGTQAADRRSAEGERAAIERRQIGHDR